MSGFIAIPNGAGVSLDVLQETLEPSLAAMRRKSLQMTSRVDAGGAAIFLFSSRHHDPAAVMTVLPSGDFCTYVGTLFYRNKTAHEATAQLQEDLESVGDRVLDEIFGNYCLIIKQRDTVRLITDYAGLYHIYSDQAFSIISSSFIGAARAMTKRSLGEQEICEYILLGATFGRQTPVREVRRCGADEELRIMAGATAVVPRRSLWEQGRGRYKAVSVEEQLELALENGRQYFSAIASNFRWAATSALSGGYDSRLVLAFLQSQGVTPRLFVYGKTSDPDVVVAKKICEAEGLSIAHVDRDATLALEPDAYWQNQETVFHGLDGVTQYGFACSPAELSHRVQRVHGGLIVVNGGCGEIWRNFWELPNRPLSVKHWIQSFYDRTASEVFAGNLSRCEFLSRLGEKAVKVIGAAADRLSRVEVESLYPRFRVRFWQGPNNGADNLIGHAVTPFAEHQFTVPSMCIPIRYKDDGWFERQLIIRLSAALARHSSSYGFDFLSGPRLHQKTIAAARKYFPPALRSMLRRLEPPEVRPYYHAQRYVRARFGGQRLEVERYVRLDKLQETLAYSRALTIERMLRNEW